MLGEVGMFDCINDVTSPHGNLRNNGYGSGSGIGSGGGSGGGGKGREGRVLPKKVMDAARRVEAEGRAGPRVVLNIKMRGEGY